jgi:hypothetical protein
MNGMPQFEPFDAVVKLLNILVRLNVKSARRDVILKSYLGGIDSYLERVGKRRD